MPTALTGPLGVALVIVGVASVGSIAATRDAGRRRERLRSLLDVVGTLVVAAAIAFLVQAYVAKPYQIPSPSMTDTFQIGDRVIAARFLYRFTDPGRGDILVFHPNGRGDEAFNTGRGEVATTTYVKRLIGMPGEWVQARNGHLQVCSGPRATRCRTLQEPYISSRQLPFGPIHVPAGHYFLMGDNRAGSSDSRVWGTIRKSQIIGRAFMVYWPLTRIRFF